MTSQPTLDELWQSTPPTGQIFDADQLAALPDPARRYLEHAIAPGAPLVSAVQLHMHGQIKLKGWFSFTAEQVIRRDRGMIWQAAVRMYGLPIRGFDRLLDGQGEMRWKMLGLIPLVTAAGSDITRSAAGRMAAETIWLPAILAGDGVTWTAPDSSCARMSLTIANERVNVDLAIDDVGRLKRIKLNRWGNPEGGEHYYAEFGGYIEREETFDGYTIPTQLRVGWHFGTERFESEGEFFRAKIDQAEFR